MNLRPTDYEFDPALSRTREIEPREPLTSGFSPQRTPTLRNVSQSVAGPMRDTSLAAHAEHRESQLLCIRIIWQQVVVRLLLVAATVFAMLSLGGLLIFAFPALALGAWWAVRHTGPLERIGWIALASLAAAEWAWEVTYPVTEGESPASWIVAGFAGAVTASLLATMNRNPTETGRAG